MRHQVAEDQGPTDDTGPGRLDTGKTDRPGRGPTAASSRRARATACLDSRVMVHRLVVIGLEALVERSEGGDRPGQAHEGLGRAKCRSASASPRY